LWDHFAARKKWVFIQRQSSDQKYFCLFNEKSSGCNQKRRAVGTTKCFVDILYIQPNFFVATTKFRLWQPFFIYIFFVTEYLVVTAKHLVAITKKKMVVSTKFLGAPTKLFSL